MADGHSGELQCVGTLEIAKPKPYGFLCGTLPVPTDSPGFPLFQSALLPSPQTFGAPRYQMLPAETDLNSPPNLPEKVFQSDFEGFHAESSTVSQSLSWKCEALAVYGLSEFGDEIDVVAPTDIMKQIFKIPYSKAQLSIAVHRIGNTLILKSGPDVEEEKVFRRQSNQSKGSDPSILSNFAMHSVRAEACDCPPSHKPSPVNQSTTNVLSGQLGHTDSSVLPSKNNNSAHSQLLDQNVGNSRKPSQSNAEEYLWNTKHKGKRAESKKKASEVGEKHRFPVQESDKGRKIGNNGFLRVLFWKFHNFRMLLGSDLLLFSNEKYAAVSLHLWDVSRKVTPLTWLEAWLDNVMASVPEIAICYHRNGVVQCYELLKTDDIFLLKGISEDGTPAFHPQVVQQNGLAVLRFLQDNCKLDPGAYWLYKGAGEDVIQLYDLSVIPKKHSTDDHDEAVNSLPSLMNKCRRDSLLSLGALLSRVAHRLSLSKEPGKRVRCANFFKKCLGFLSEQDHLVVRAYAHEQFARLILEGYQELELTSESYLLDSEATVTNLEDECTEYSLEMFLPESQAEGACSTADLGLEKDDIATQTTRSGASSKEKLEMGEPASSTGAVISSTGQDNLMVSEIASPHMVTTIVDSISSKLVAIHHVTQAIKSLRLKRQLQNTEGDLNENANRMREKTSSICICGDVDCIELCDIREWLPKYKFDHKMWKLILLLGESYLSLAEAYKEDGQLFRTLKVVRLACLLFGSMPQQFEDAQFISSMSSSSSCQLEIKRESQKSTIVMDARKDLKPRFYDEPFSSDQLSPTYLFWVKAWTILGDVYVEYHRSNCKDVLTQTHGNQLKSDVQMSNEVVKEIKRLKKKLGQSNPNCGTCSLMNCSCQSDRASSGNSASSSSGDAHFSGRKQQRKSLGRNSLYLSHGRARSDVCDTDGSQHYSPIDMHDGVGKANELIERCTVADEAGTGFDLDNCSKNNDGIASCNFSGEDSTQSKDGGIFRFLRGPKPGDVEYNLSTAASCYKSVDSVLLKVTVGSAEIQSLFKKRGWVFNELGRYRLELKDLESAEIAFSDAIKAFKEVSDHTNIILINCNLGHGRRALAEELVSKMDELKKYEVLQNAYKQSMASAKMQYTKSLKYYDAAMKELSSVGDKVEPSLHNEVCTQYAHTYLRFGMLLAKESISSLGVDEQIGGINKEHEINVTSASDAFRVALSTYESLGVLRKQEAAFTHFQLACYYRDSCLKFLDLDHRQAKHCKSENRIRQKAKWYASLAEKNWQRSIKFYAPKSHPTMYLNILMELSALCTNLATASPSATMLEAALAHLLEGRHVVEAEDASDDKNLDIKVTFWNQLQTLLKDMLAASLGTRPGIVGQSLEGSRPCNVQKLREMYRISLKSNNLCELHRMHNLWVS